MRILFGVLLTVLFATIAACDGSSSANKSSNAVESEQARLQPDWQAVLSTPTNTVDAFDEAKSAIVASQFTTSGASQVTEYQAKVAESLASEVPILALGELDDSKAKVAQDVLLADSRLAQILFHSLPNADGNASAGKQPLRNEVMSVKPALPGDRVGAASVCQLAQCYRVDIYNFFFNVTVTGIVDVINEKVVVISSLPETQPDLSPRLERLSIAIAKYEPAVKKELSRYLSSRGIDNKQADISPLMVSTKSALKNSLCERSKHLCVAPTYVLGDKALWVIVDLTDMKVAGLRWTTVGETGPPVVVTQRIIENEFVFKNYCQQISAIERNGWSLNYHLTSSDGLRIADVSFKDKAVFDSAKVVDWHVSYSRQDGFGYSDATGCPMFSSAVVVAYDGPQIEPIIENGSEVGFAVVQDFRQLSWPAACNYRYEERYEFYNDGRYRVAMSNHGRGCGTDGTYRPVLRIEIGRPEDQQGQQNSYTLEQWLDNEWKVVEEESWARQPLEENLYRGQYSHRFLDQAGQGYFLSPSIGQFWDGGRGDDAFIYATVSHPNKDEGTSDLVTLGSCCNTNHEQGPEQFMQPAELLLDQSLVLWYVPQIHNDGEEGSKYCWADTKVVDGVQRVETWPCTGGPMFNPISPAKSDQAVLQE